MSLNDSYKKYELQIYILYFELKNFDIGYVNIRSYLKNSSKFE